MKAHSLGALKGADDWTKVRMCAQLYVNMTRLCRVAEIIHTCCHVSESLPVKCMDVPNMCADKNRRKLEYAYNRGCYKRG